MAVLAGQHHIIKETSESLGEFLQGVFRESGYKRVHLVVAAPKQEAIEGKLPACGIYLYNITLDEEGIGSNRTDKIIDRVIGPDGDVREVQRDTPLWVRLDYLISTWAQTPEEEQLLLGAAIKGIIETPVLAGEQLKGESFAMVHDVPLLLSQKLDEGVLSRFWASLNQPLKPAMQVWTSIPIYPTKESDITRVIEKDVRFFDLNRLNRARK
jgi:hypothetical protein